MEANLLVYSDVVDGAIIHPTLPMSYIAEKIILPEGNLDAEWNLKINTVHTFNKPFFHVFAQVNRANFYELTGSGNSFNLYMHRYYTYAEGKYKYYNGEREAFKITLPMTLNGVLYIGDMRG